MMDWIYIAISWILLRWHDLWDTILPDRSFLATNWDWILAIVFLVITVRIILFPIFVKQIRSQRAMQALQPKMKELQEKHKGDQQTLREEMMKLYQTEKVNPLMGCLPMFLQIPVFLGLFHVLNRLDPVQTLNTTLYTWTQAQWDSAAVARLFDAPIASKFASNASDLAIMDADGVTVKVVAGVLVLVMMATTFLTSRQMILKTGWSADPQQRMIQKLMLYGIPISLLLSGWYFPIGVIIYWVTQNLFSLGQQYWVLHKYPPPASAGSIPMKAAKATPAKATPTPRSVLARFLPIKSDPSRPSANGAAAAGNGFKPVQPETKSGLFRRRQETPTAPETPAVDSRSLAPKPGAKPVHPKQGVGEPVAPKSTANPPAKATANPPAKATANPPAKATANPPAKATPNPPGAQKAAEAQKSTGAQKSSGAKKTTATPRKGPAGKRRGSKR